MSASAPNASAAGGKIRGLTYELRDQLCRQMRDGLRGQALLAWLDRHAPQFAPFNAENVSNWRHTGYAQWLRDQERLQAIRDAADSVRRECQARGETLFDRVAMDYAQALADARVDSSAETVGKLAGAAAALISARTAQIRAENDVQRTGIAKQALVLQRDRFQVQTCELFLKWFADAAARKIAESAAPKADKIAALRKDFFQDVDALEKSGSVVLPE